MRGIKGKAGMTKIDCTYFATPAAVPEKVPEPMPVFVPVAAPLNCTVPV